MYMGFKYFYWEIMFCAVFGLSRLLTDNFASFQTLIHTVLMRLKYISHALLVKTNIGAYLCAHPRMSDLHIFPREEFLCPLATEACTSRFLWTTDSNEHWESSICLMFLLLALLVEDWFWTFCTAGWGWADVDGWSDVFSICTKTSIEAVFHSF